MIHVLTRTGKYKDISEDAVLMAKEVLVDTVGVFEMSTPGFICLSDGVGGNKAGNVASEYILRELASYSPKDIHELRNHLIDINERLIMKSMTNSNLHNMATTITGFYFTQREVYLIHIGNTRAYLMQGKYLKQITSDHTTFNYLRSIGQFEEAERCNRSEITNCFGGGNSKLGSKLVVSNLQPFKRALLTSDGAHEYLSIDVLEDILSMNISDREKCEKIYDMAVQAGSEDDISVVLINNQKINVQNRV